MNPREFFINPADYGLPTREELVAYRIWDTHFHGFYGSGNPLAQFRANNFYVERMGIERSISLEIGGTLPEPLKPGKFYDVSVPLKSVAQTIPKGHRLRVAVSSTYWPMVWPSPEDVTLTVDAA